MRILLSSLIAKNPIENGLDVIESYLTAASNCDEPCQDT